MIPTKFGEDSLEEAHNESTKLNNIEIDNQGSRVRDMFKHVNSPRNENLK